MFCISVRFSYWKIVVTWALVILRLSYRTISPERCIMTYLWVNLSFNCIIHLMVRLLDLTTNKIFHTAFWHLKVTQPLLCYSVNLAFVSSPSRIFISSPIGFHASPVEKLLPGLTTEKIWRFYLFSGDSSSPHRVTETLCGKASDISPNQGGRALWDGVAQKEIMHFATKQKFRYWNILVLLTFKNWQF